MFFIKCPKCAVDCASLDNLQIHLVNQHGGKYACPFYFCNKVYPTKKDLLQHAQEHWFACWSLDHKSDLCVPESTPKQITTIAQLDQQYHHYMAYHAKIENACDQCLKQFYYMYQKEIHKCN